MNISRFFIDRPIFAGVLSLLIFIAGFISIWKLPISEYPEVVPPSVVVRAQFPGANPKTIAETVAAPLEEQINGVEDMLYMFSQGTSDGQMTLTITFKIGTDPDKAQQLVQNRVNQALPRLPDIVRQFGVTTVKSSSDLTMVVHLLSPQERYDTLYLGNYATLNIKDRLSRLPGVGKVEIFGSSDYAMRVWLDPDKIASRGLLASDVVNAIREQNVQVAAGVIGASPSIPGLDLQLNINTKGRLQSEEEFGNIIVKTSSDGAITRLKDVARIELGGSHYLLRSMLDNKPAAALGIFQAPGSNIIDVSDNVRKTMESLKRDFPDDIDYTIVYDPTIFIRDSIKAVVYTLLEAIALVVIVVILFLQTWRASIIPLLAVPVSIVGTFALMLPLGFSINALSLFGLVLAIGIVVDDAIVVVENVERNIEMGLSPRMAAYQAMREVSGPIIAIGLTLVAVFVPIAFVSGLNGQFYRQFALTIAISTVISAINSLTLSPAMAAKLLKSHDAPKDRLTRLMEDKLGWIFRPFNRMFKQGSDRYHHKLTNVLNRKALMMGIYLVLIAMTAFVFSRVPTGYIPQQDKQYLIGFAQLPNGASLDRTDDVIKRMSDIILSTPGVEHAVEFAGLSINGFTVSSSAGIVFVTLKPYKDRKLSAEAISQQLNQQFGAIKDAFVMVLPPPPIIGLGTTGGFKLQVEDRSELGDEALHDVIQTIQGRAWQTPGLAGVFSGYQINVPQLYVEIDRTKAKQLGIPITNIFETMQIYLGSLYVNDFNKFGRTYQVIAQADAPFRANAQDITKLKVRNAKGEMVPLGSVLQVHQSYGPERSMHYNGYPTAEINGGAAPGFSSGQAQAIMEKILKETLPKGMAYEWTELTYQQILAGDTAMFVFPLCVLLVFLVLAAQYESLVLPLAVILIVPMCLLCAITAVWLSGGDNNIFTQIGLFVLVGLACKNAILIVEFARELEFEGRTPLQAALEAARLRLRPILMTSFAFIMGVVPLMTSTGAGSEMRHAMGTAVFFGMLGVTFFGLFMTPVFYVLLRNLSGKRLTTQNPVVLQTQDDPHPQV
ncbi:MAG: multidrug efflux RND transporter permease subunit [Gammaproteobacteria bacterium 39-13]|nr:efflux RND transporter permease subunit [Gammaproteobacteria bacterium]OJV96657.1 MAG: multidrug efflux RND transporter permease subunit [Gammaproteobacteria bacterium 39-13]